MRTSVPIRLIKRKKHAEIVQEAMEKLLKETKTKLKDMEALHQRLGIDQQAIRDYIQRSGFSLQDRIKVEQEAQVLIDNMGSAQSPGSTDSFTLSKNSLFTSPQKQVRSTQPNRKKSTFKI